VASRWALRRDQEGRPTAILEINTDVTERVLAEKALQESEERYRRLFEDDLTGDYLATPEAQILACNPAFLELFGFTDLSQALQTSLIELRRNPEEWPAFLDRLKGLGRLKHHQSVMRRLDGQEIYVVENAVGVLDRAGRLIQIKGYLFDDTERQRSERLLQEAEERYRLLVEMIPDAVLVSDAQTVRFVKIGRAHV
jgi:PAS domain S-box-containing protein